MGALLGDVGALLGDVGFSFCGAASAQRQHLASWGDPLGFLWGEGLDFLKHKYKLQTLTGVDPPSTPLL